MPVKHKRRTTKRYRTMVFIFIILCVLLYLVFGVSLKNNWRYKRRHAEAAASLATPHVKELLCREVDTSGVHPRFAPLVKRLALNTNNLTAGNAVNIIVDGREKQRMLMEDLRRAKEYIHMEYFHFGVDEGSRSIKQLLEEKAEEGVKVRFLNENIANIPIPGAYYRSMRQHGVEVCSFTPYRHNLISFFTLLNYRDHRKTVVIDGNVAYTGGMNINDNYFCRWRDTHMRLTGDAVDMLQATFLDTWLSSGGKLDKPIEHYFAHEKQTNRIASAYAFEDKRVQIVPDDPSSDMRTAQMAYEWVFDHAQDYVYIQTPYFAPPKHLLDAMKGAAKRGVDVVLMLPEKTDHPLLRYTNRAYYEECLEAGIRIVLRGGEFIHSKTFVCDDYLSQIGTSNMDMRSLELSYELNAFIYDRETALSCRQIFLDDLDICRELSLQAWRERSRWQRPIEQLFRCFAPVL